MGTAVHIGVLRRDCRQRMCADLCADLWRTTSAVSGSVPNFIHLTSLSHYIERPEDDGAELPAPRAHAAILRRVQHR